MDSIKRLYQDMGDWLTWPFKQRMPVSQLLLFFALFLVIAFIAYDSVSILKSWMETATETVADSI